MATYGAGLRIDDAVNATRTTTGTVFTVPAGKAVFGQIGLDGGGVGQITIGGNNYFTGTFSVLTTLAPIYIGPGIVVAMTVTSGSCRTSLTGVQLSN